MSTPSPTPTESRTDIMSDAGTDPGATTGPSAEPGPVAPRHPGPTTGPSTEPGPSAPRDIRRLRRRADRRLLGGVCGGFADYSGADVALIRVLMVALMIFGGTGFALYAAAWLLVPVEGSSRSPAERLLGR
jgi:phage shock protein PspC (stress-responsive transcriptional regulator)